MTFLARTVDGSEPPLQAPEQTIRENVREVLVPVVVTDKKGHYMSDLKKSDFAIAEDGVAQKIVGFSTASGAAVAGLVNGRPGSEANSGAALPNATRSGHTYWIVIDTLHSSFTNFNRTRDALIKFFRQERSPDSEYSLTAIGRDIRVIQSSTGDPAAILSVVQNKSIEKAILDSEASNTSFDATQFAGAVRQYCEVCVGACLNWPATGNREWCDARRSQVQSMLSQFADRTLVLNREFLRLLNKQVHEMASVPTSRTVVFISDGFNRFAGQEFDAVLHGFGAADRGFVFNQQDMQPELDAILKEAVASNVRFYTLDSRGVYTLAEVAGSGADASSGGLAPQAVQTQASVVAQGNADALAELAHDTGGVFFENSNDLLKGIRRAFADGREYYVLSYVPTNATANGKFRKISVSVTEKNLLINAKVGYWAPGN